MLSENEVKNESLITSDWQSFLQIGGYASLLTLLLAIFELLITFLPGGNVEGLNTIGDWFDFFQEYPFMGLRTLGLVNFGLISLGVVAMVALYGVLHKTSGGWVMLAAVLSFMSAGVFFATNRAFPMLVLSNQYAAATSDAQRAMLEAAGTAMVAVGQSHAPGTFMAYILGSLSSIIIAFVMLRSDFFSNITAYVGIIAFTCLLIFEIMASVFPSMFQLLLLLAGVGGILSMVWQGMVGLRLLKLAKSL